MLAYHIGHESNMFLFKSSEQIGAQLIVEEQETVTPGFQSSGCFILYHPHGNPNLVLCSFLLEYYPKNLLNTTVKFEIVTPLLSYQK